MKYMNRILEMIQSWRDSSNKSVSMKDEKFILTGMNSPRTSRQHVDVKYGHGYDDLQMIILNDYWVIKPLTRAEMYEVDDDDKEEIGKNSTRCNIPASWIENMLVETGMFPFGVPGWLTGVCASFQPSRFLGYGENGEPIWETRRAEILGYDPVSYRFLPDEKEKHEYE